MDDSELLNLFWAEVGEYLDVMNKQIMALEMSQADEDAGAFVERLRELNRVAHSLKGAARAVGVREVERLGHHMEDVFEAALRRGLAITPAIADLLYDALDLIQQVVDGQPIDPNTLHTVTVQLERAVQANVTDVENLDDPGTDAPPRHDATPFRPVGTNGTQTPPSTTRDTPPPSPTEPEPPPPPPTDDPLRMTRTLLMRPADDTVRVAVDKLDKLMQESSELVVTTLQGEVRKQHAADLRKLHRRWAREWRTVRSTYIRLARRLQTEHDDALPDDLQQIMDFLETNQRYLTDTARAVSQLAGMLSNDSMRLAALTDDLQDSIGSLRLVPFDTIMAALHRTVRDAARETGKDAHLDIVGGSTEIDKTVLEHLKDPLMHIVRNAVDHGIEAPDERARVGKPEAGWVYLNVEQRGNEIVIVAADDGRGIDTDQVRWAAVERGTISPLAAQTMSAEDAAALIFHPGLTTRNTVTAISGRGVGLDVVRERVESLRGRVSVSSTPGKGSLFTLSVPVSLTRIRSVLLRLGHEQYAVPSLSVLRMERVPRSEAFTAEGRPMVQVGERALPLVSLADMLDVPLMIDEDPAAGGLLRLLVLAAADKQVAFEVDELLSERELVLKPLGAELAHTRYVSGASLLGSGRVVIMLDANDLVRGATGSSLPSRRKLPGSARVADDPKRLRVLVVDDSITTRTLEKNILETAGCDVIVAYDGLQALAIIAENTFDVIITDVEMPRLDGLALTARLKNSPATRHIPVILLTSLNKPEHREAGLEAGADAYLVKSNFDQDELLHTIQAVL